jgi:CubicO group peptidase (beta-lactamase class C family)
MRPKVHVMKTRRRLALALVLAAAVAPLAWGQALAPASPESVGMSSARLRRIGETMKRYVEEGRISGAVTLVAREGRLVHLDAFGKPDLEKSAAMQKDSIFRIASMSKALTSVAVMLLMEDGRLLISDPVSKYIPAFKGTSVADASGGQPVAAKRPITLRDLLTHTAGIGYGSAARAQYQAAGFDEWYFADKAEPIGTWIEKLAGLPFDAQPGERYVYGYSTDILGAVVEKASGLSLDEFLKTRLLRPLRMVDTHFFLPEEKRARFTTVYAAKESGGIERAPDTGRNQGAYVDGPRACFSGGAGLLSTAPDYARFLQMLLNGGELDGTRLLSPKTVELMTSNHVGNLYNEGRFGFGLGFEITEHVGRSGRYGSVGEFGWGGAYFTQFWVDPQERLLAVFMTQLLPSRGLDLQAKFRALVYEAIETSAAWPVSRPAAAGVARRP